MSEHSSLERGTRAYDWWLAWSDSIIRLVLTAAVIAAYWSTPMPGAIAAIILVAAIWVWNR